MAHLFLVNKTKRELIFFGELVSEKSVKFTSAIHMAFVSYMIEHPDNDFAIMDDTYYLEEMTDTEVDLSKYKFKNAYVMPSIIRNFEYNVDWVLK
jgi:hypothetical protein